MSEYRVSARYAKSILDLANEQKCIDAILADMNTFIATVASNKELRNLLSSPIINGDKKMSVLKSVFEKGFQALTISFFAIVIRKKRENCANRSSCVPLERGEAHEPIISRVPNHVTLFYHYVTIHLTQHFRLFGTL